MNDKSLNCFSTFPVQMLPHTGVGGLRRFSGVGYTGDVIERHYHWGNVIFDMENISFASRVPILLEHDEAEIVGYADTHQVTEQGELVIGGVLSNTTEASKRVTGLSDEGYPWQMSVRIDPEYVEFVESGKEATVNGRTVRGPLNIFRNGKISEVSFTSVGWDSNTTAEALSHKKEQFSKEDSMTSEKVTGQAEDQVSMLMSQNAALMSELNEYKKKFSDMEEERKKKEAEENMSKLKSAFSECGSEKSDEELKKYSNFSSEAVQAIVDAMAVAKQFANKSGTSVPAKLPAALTSDVATDGDTTRFAKQGEGFADRLAARFNKGGK